MYSCEGIALPDGHVERRASAWCMRQLCCAARVVATDVPPHCYGLRQGCDDKS